MAVAAAKTLLECTDLEKVVCGSFNQGRKYAIRDILFGAPRDNRLRREERFVLRGFSVIVRAGENVAVLGMADSGKTTIAKLVTRMLRPDGGSVHVDGRVGLIVGGKLGMNPFLTVEEYTELATNIHGAEPDVAAACREEVLGITGLATQRATRIVDLPKGALRNLSLVCALVVPKDLRVFDGVPVLGKDPVGERVAARRLAHFDRGSNLILSSTTAGLPSNVSRALIVHGGETLYDGRPETVIPIYDSFVSRMRRIQKVALDRQERGTTVESDAEAPAPSPAILIERAVRSLDRSQIAHLAEDSVAQAWRSNQPLVLGPCFSDVDFELLCWRPFIAWMRQRFGPRTPQVVAVSRGRVSHWYAGLVSEYIDVCDLLPFERFQTLNQERIRDSGSKKQTVISNLDRELLDAVGRRLGIAETTVIHPSVLYRVFLKIWRGVVPTTWLGEHGHYECFQGLPDGRLSADPYVVAGFWFNANFPDNSRNRSFVNDLLVQLSRRVPVVVVERVGFPHVAGSLADGRRIRVVSLKQTEREFSELAGVIAGARAFIGTFGGTSLIAPFYNVPTSLVIDEPVGLRALHFSLAKEVAAAMPNVRFDLTKMKNFHLAQFDAWIDQALS